jgi:hypothetical protein
MKLQCRMYHRQYLQRGPRLQDNQQSRANRTSGGLLAATLALPPRRLQLPVALRVDRLLPPSEHVLRRDVADGAVQSDVL